MRRTHSGTYGAKAHWPAWGCANTTSGGGVVVKVWGMFLRMVVVMGLLVGAMLVGSGAALAGGSETIEDLKAAFQEQVAGYDADLAEDLADLEADCAERLADADAEEVAEIEFDCMLAAKQFRGDHKFDVAMAYVEFLEGKADLLEEEAGMETEMSLKVELKAQLLAYDAEAMHEIALAKIDLKRALFDAAGDQEAIDEAMMRFHDKKAEITATHDENVADAIADFEEDVAGLMEEEEPEEDEDE